MSYSIKNNTSAIFDVFGMELEPGESYEIQPGDKARAMSDQDTVQGIISGELAFYDDMTLLTPAQAFSFLANQITIRQGITSVSSVRQLEISGNAVLTNEGNGVAQIHIKEGTSGTSGSVFPAIFSKSGGSGNTWLERGEGGIYGYQAPYILPFPVRLVGITYSNRLKNTDVGIELYKLEESDENLKGDYLVLNWELYDSRMARKTDMEEEMGNEQYFKAGDSIAIYKKDLGTNCDDCVVVLYFEIMDYKTEEKNYYKYNNFNR